jgi:hypothetical protein
MITIQEIATGVAVKRSILAQKMDQGLAKEFDFDPRIYYQGYRDAYYEADTHMGYRFTIDEIAKYCDDIRLVNRMVADNTLVSSYLSKEDLDKLVADKRKYTLENYVEVNNYYRIYLGLPPIMKDKFGNYIDDPDYIFYNKVPISGVDITKPVHKYNATERSLFSVSGELAKMIIANPKAKYLRYLDKDVDIVSLRDANEFEIVWFDKNDGKISDFVEHYRAVRNQFMRSHYRELDAIQYPYYEGFICAYLLMAAMADYNANIPIQRLKNNEIDESEIYLLFESYGLPKFDFSQKYLLEIANRINTLTYKKGTKDGLQLISKMFEEISIYKYYIVKRLKNQGVLNYDGMSNKDKYELFFVKAPLSADDPYEYMQKEENVTPYMDVVSKDPRWGVENDKLEDTLKDWEFSYSESKYLGLNNKIEISTFSLEMAYFYRYIIEHKDIVSKLKIYLDTVDVQADLFELITYMQALIFRKFKVSPDIPDTLSSIIYMYSIKNKVDYERLKLVFREHFKYHENKANIDGFIDLLDNQDYTLNGIMDTFEINYKIIEYLYDLRSTLTRYDDYHMVDTIIKAITFGEKVPELYNNKTNLEDFLSTYNSHSSKYVVRINELLSSSDPVASINNEITVIINLLRDQVDNIRHKKLLSLFDTAQNLYSDLDIIKYLEKIIDFYKSYTQDIIDRGVVYSMSDITDGLQIVEELKIRLDLKDWEVFTLSLLFTGDNTEYVRFLLDNFKKVDYFSQTEILSIIHEDVTQEIIGVSGWKNTF